MNYGWTPLVQASTWKRHEFVLKAIRHSALQGKHQVTDLSFGFVQIAYVVFAITLLLSGGLCCRYVDSAKVRRKN